MKLFLVLLSAAVVYGARFEKATTKIPGSFLIKVKLLTLDSIDYVEEDGVFYTQAVGSWGLDRVDQRNLPLDGSYTPPRRTHTETVYVIDTGIRHSHLDFGGRASNHFDYESGNGEDCNGHGTHCAGIAGSKTYGVAIDVNLKSVRVLSCFGSGSTTNVVNGVNSINMGIGSMSVGGGASSTFDDAVRNAVDRGVVMCVVAGNSNADACNYSPGREPSAITVAATDSSDNRASSSNYGSCVDIFAPGVSITSTWHDSDTATNTISGTSMACPHVAGAAALLRANGVSAGDVPSELTSGGTSGVISDLGPGSPDIFLYVQ